MNDEGASPPRNRPIQLAYREMLDRRLIFFEISVVSGLIGLFTVIGPLATNESLSALLRLAFWTSCAVLCWPMCHAQHTLTLYHFRTRPPWQIVLLAECNSLVMAIPCACVVYVLHGLFYNTGYYTPDLLSCYAVVAVTLSGTVALWIYVATQRSARGSTGDSSFRPTGEGGEEDPQESFSAAARTPSERQADHSNPPIRHPSTVQQPGRPQISESPQANLLFDRLPSNLGRDIIWIRAVEHYTQVTTTKDKALVLIRFSDAVASLSGLGMQVHRSHWVALRHIKRLQTRGNQVLLQLSDGHEVPVSRPHRDDVRRYLKSLSNRDPM